MTLDRFYILLCREREQTNRARELTMEQKVLVFVVSLKKPEWRAIRIPIKVNLRRTTVVNS